MPVLISYGCAFLAIICYAVLPVIARKMSISVPPFLFIVITMTILAACSLAAALIRERGFHFANVGMKNWLWLFAFSFINFLGFSAYLAALARIPVTNYQLIGLITPLVGGFAAFLVLGETVTWRFVCGFALSALGIAIALV